MASKLRLKGETGKKQGNDRPTGRRVPDSLVEWLLLVGCFTATSSRTVASDPLRLNPIHHHGQVVEILKTKTFLALVQLGAYMELLLGRRNGLVTPSLKLSRYHRLRSTLSSWCWRERGGAM
jgi:hypothetical protein